MMSHMLERRLIATCMSNGSSETEVTEFAVIP